MNEEQYQQQLTIANTYKDKADFKDAEIHYRRALKYAPAQEMQALIDQIREMKEKAKVIPKLAEEKQRGAEQGFQIHKTTFNDVIGYKKHKKLLMELIESPIKYTAQYTERKMTKSTGILLYGAPGTGKTWIGKGISGELKIPMKVIFVSDILGKLVGESEKNMKKAFEDAKSVQPSIIFFDELDALGASRESANEMTSNDIKNTINEFLEQLSELHDNKEDTVFVIGATNLPWRLDSALKRSGRFEHHIYMRPPDIWERRQIFKYYLKMEQTQSKVNWTLISLATIRYSQADIEKICNQVKRRTLDKNVITTRDIQKILKDKTLGTSSLDNWVLEAQKNFIKNSKDVVHRTGFMGWHKQKEKIESQGSLSDDELRIYKPIINNIKSYKRWWTISNIIRRMAKGI